MKKDYKVCWLSAGVSSFIAGYLNDTAIFTDGEGKEYRRTPIDEWIYIDIKDQHPDSMRFIRDCEKIIGKKVTILKSDRFNCVEDVIRKYKFINSEHGAPCTGMLKKAVRKKWENEYKEHTLTYVWGMDLNEKNRAERLNTNFPEQMHEFPLIDLMLKKQDCHAIANRMEISRPLMYELGYQNNNCIGCVKGGMGYWNKIRKDFPEVFESRAKLEREIGASCINGTFLDELEPDRGRIEDEISTDCGIMCYLNL